MLYKVLVLFDVIILEKYLVDSALSVDEVHSRVDLNQGRENRELALWRSVHLKIVSYLR